MNTSYVYVVDPANGTDDTFYSTGANDELIIAQAIAKLPSSGGVVYFVGSFVISNPIFIPHGNITLQGQGKATTITLANNINKDMIIINLSGGSTIFNIEIRDLTLNGNNAHQTSGDVIKAYSTSRLRLDYLDIVAAHDYAINLIGTSAADSYWNFIEYCNIDNQNKGGWVNETHSHENFFTENIMIGSGPGFYGINSTLGFDEITNNKFGGGFGSTAGTLALISLSGSNPSRIIGNQFNGSLQEIIRITGAKQIITGNQISNASVNSPGVYSSIYITNTNNIITQNIFNNDASTPLADIQESTGSDSNLIAENQFNIGVIRYGTSSIIKDNLGQTIPTRQSGNGWTYNSVDNQVITKSNVYNPGTTEINNELAAAVALGAKYYAHAIPYNNTAKWALWMPLIRAAGLIPSHRSHWDEWQGDNGAGNIATSTSLTGTGTTATCVTQNPHGLSTGDTVSINGVTQTEYQGEFAVTVVNSTTFTYTTRSSVTAATATASGGGIGWRYGRATYLRLMKAFIIAHPTYFATGDLFGGCVEADQAASAGANMCFFTQGTTTFNFTLYNQFLKDVKTNADSGFATNTQTVGTFPMSFGVSNLNLAGVTLDDGTTGNVLGLADADIVANFNGILTIDHYIKPTYRSSDNYGAIYISDIDKIHQAFPSCRILIGEFGYPTNTALSDQEQFLVYQQVVTALQSRTYINGINFWDMQGGTTESLFRDSSGSIITPGRKAATEVLYAFTSQNSAT